MDVAGIQAGPAEAARLLAALDTVHYAHALAGGRDSVAGPARTGALASDADVAAPAAVRAARRYVGVRAALLEALATDGRALDVAASSIPLRSAEADVGRKRGQSAAAARLGAPYWQLRDNLLSAKRRAGLIPAGSRGFRARQSSGSLMNTVVTSVSAMWPPSSPARPTAGADPSPSSSVTAPGGAPSSPARGTTCAFSGMAAVLRVFDDGGGMRDSHALTPITHSGSYSVTRLACARVAPLRVLRFVIRDARRCGLVARSSHIPCVSRTWCCCSR